MPNYLSTDPSAGEYLSDDPSAGEPIAPATPKAAPQAELSPAVGVAKGALKGAAGTVLGLGKMVASAGGLGELSPEQAAAFRPETWGLQAQTPAEKIGRGAEQVAEFVAIPGPGKATGLAKAAKLAGAGTAAAGLARAQGATPGQAIAAGVLTGVPFIEGAAKLLGWTGNAAIRGVLKPTVAAMKRISGGKNLDAKAQEVVEFIIENKLTTPEKAQALMQKAENELQRILAVKNAPTDAATRAARYLDALEKHAAKGGLSGEKVAMLRRKMADLIEGPMGETVGYTSTGLPVRGLRQTVPAKEALESARASGKWSTQGKWGPKDTPEAVGLAAEKAVERAQRDAVKAAVPESVPLLSQYGKAKDVEGVLGRALLREGNKNLTGLAGSIELGTRSAPIMGFALRLLREGSLGGGVMAGRLANAIQRGNGPEVAFYLQKMGVAVPAQMLRPAEEAR